MKLSELIARLPGTRSGAVPSERSASTRDVRGLTPHLRDVRPGMAFFALPGEIQTNPYAIQAACERGAALVVCGTELTIPAHAPTIQVEDPRAAFAAAAAAFRSFPAEHLTLIAVTGDPAIRPGVAAVLASLLDALDLPTAVLGQNGYSAAGRLGTRSPAELDASEINHLLAQHVAKGGRCVVVEFDAEHPPEGFSGFQFKRQITVSATSDFKYCRPLLLNPRGSRVEIRGPHDPRVATTPLVGFRSIFALNLVWPHAVALAESFQRTAKAVANTLPILLPVRGWLKPVYCGQPFGVLVDGSTQPDELTAALRDARQLTRGRLHLVVGARAAQTRDERAALGAAALTHVDQLHITSDNPRHLPLAQLAGDLLGSSPTIPCIVEMDRRRAVYQAVKAARAGDVVVLTGKAYRPWQELHDVVVPFDDHEVAAAALHHRGYLGGDL